MNKSLRVIVPVAFLSAVIIVSYLVFVPKRLTRENSVKVEGVVKSVGLNGLKDIAIGIDGYKSALLINSGIKRGFDIGRLRSRLVGKHAEVLYLKPHWLSGFVPMKSAKYITELKTGKEIVFSEL